MTRKEQIAIGLDEFARAAERAQMRGCGIGEFSLACIRAIASFAVATALPRAALLGCVAECLDDVETLEKRAAGGGDVQ